MFVQRCLHVRHRSAVFPGRFHVHRSGAEAQFLTPGQFLPHRHHRLETLPPLLPRLSAHSVAESTRLLLRWMLLGAAVVRPVAMTTMSPGAGVWFFFEGGSRKPKAGQLAEQ